MLCKAGPRQTSQRRPVKILPQPDRTSHSHALLRQGAIDSEFHQIGEPSRES